jgi:hypothetical protein
MAKRAIGMRATTRAAAQAARIVRPEIETELAALAGPHRQVVDLLDEMSALMHLHGVDVRCGDGLSIDGVVDAVQGLEAYDAVWPGKI